MAVFPGSPQPAFIPWSTFEKQGYDSEAIFMSTHTGTHVDAPSHFAPGHPGISKIPLTRLFSTNALLISTPKTDNQLIEIRDIENEGVKENDTVLLATGWEQRASETNYMSANPGLAASAARYLAKKRVNVVCIDGPSIDAGSDHSFSSHKILLSRNILAVENLCNLQKIKRKRFMLVIAPLKLQSATGSPARVMAILQ